MHKIYWKPVKFNITELKSISYIFIRKNLSWSNFFFFLFLLVANLWFECRQIFFFSWIYFNRILWNNLRAFIQPKSFQSPPSWKIGRRKKFQTYPVRSRFSALNFLLNILYTELSIHDYCSALFPLYSFSFLFFFPFFFFPFSFLIPDLKLKNDESLAKVKLLYPFPKTESIESLLENYFQQFPQKLEFPFSWRNKLSFFLFCEMRASSFPFTYAFFSLP